MNFNQFHTLFCRLRTKLHELLTDIKDTNASNYTADTVRVMNIRRNQNFALEDALRHVKMSKHPKLTEKWLLVPPRVVFAMEEATDLMGVGRHLCTLVLNTLCGSNYMAGPKEKMTLRRNQDKVTDGSFKALGQLLSMLAVNYGMSIPFLCTPVIFYIIHQQYPPLSTFTIDLVEDEEMKLVLQNVSLVLANTNYTTVYLRLYRS